MRTASSRTYGMPDFLNSISRASPYADSRKPNPSVACTRRAHPMIAYASGFSFKTTPTLYHDPGLGA